MLEASLAFDNFLNSIRSEATRDQYVYLLKRYIRFLGTGLNGPMLSVIEDPKVIESQIIKLIVVMDSNKIPHMTDALSDIAKNERIYSKLDYPLCPICMYKEKPDRLFKHIEEHSINDLVSYLTKLAIYYWKRQEIVM